tara:strand:+ start:1439 stop:2407 length:969 start_codon:yes stop_codon:yes gene_type:complete
LVLGGQILHYYLKVFSLIIVTFLIITFLYAFYVLNRNLDISDKLITIKKGERFESFLNQNINDLLRLELLILKIYYKTSNVLLDKFIHFGEFYIEQDISALKLLEIISNPSNVINRITIVEGWTNKQLNFELSKFFKKTKDIAYEDIIADTYFLEKNSDFKNFNKNLITIKSKYMNNFKDNIVYKKFTENEIMTIGSLLEKEGLDIEDKKKISSVIFNRLNKKMKLQIDATVIYALTNGEYNMKRNLLLKDLKIDHPYNTYIYNGLPPKPISYVGKETLDIIFENYKTDFLFYFFNKSLNRHIFSKTYEEHRKKLNDYRNKK